MVKLCNNKKALTVAKQNKTKQNNNATIAAMTYQTYRFNSLAPGRPAGWHCKIAIFNLVLLIGIFTSSKDNALR